MGTANKRREILLPRFRGPDAASKAAVLRIRLEHASRNATVSGVDELAGRSNYLIGNDPAKWRRNIPTFNRVKYQGIYPGVDLVYYGNQRQLEYDFVLAPGVDPLQIELSFNGAKRLRLDADGNLVVSIAGGEIVEHAPVIYQDIDGTRRRVAGSYDLRSGHTVAFKLAAYDHQNRLTIDPSLVYSTYLGGSGVDAAYGLAVDSAGNAYVAGLTSSSNFPTTTGVLQTTFPSNYHDAFVSKLNSAGSALVYSTYLGGSDEDQGGSIVVDSSGNAYVAGSTHSIDFPTTPGAMQTTFGGGPWDGFVSKLNSDGSALVYSTYLGGSGDYDYGHRIAVDSGGNAYVTGHTDSTNFPTTAGALQPTSGSFDAFVAKFGNRYGICALYDQTKKVKSGSTVPIKLELCDSKGNDLSSSTITVHGVSLSPLSSEAPGSLEASGNANPDNDFRFDATLGTSGGYIFNLSSKGLGTGTWGLDFTAGPTAETHQVEFGVAK